MQVDADPTRLEQIFVNLLTNAAKYTPSFGKISLRAQPVGEHFAVSIQDNGEEISAEMLPRILEGS